MNANEFIKLIEVLIWPTVVLVIFFSSRKSIFKLISQYDHVEVTSSVARVILKNLEYNKNVSSTQIKKLRGLTGHDLWALEGFMKQSNESFKYVHKFSSTRKAMVYSFIQMGLLEIIGEGENRYVQPTKLASDIIDEANKLL